MKMNTLICNLHCVWILACLFSCQSENETAPIEPACAITLEGQSVSQMEVEIKASALTVFISANTDWKLESDSEWCRLSNLSGKAIPQGEPKEVTINIERNTTDDVRTAHMRLVAETASAQLQINQAGYIQVDDTKWENAVTAVHNMRVGWNLGNSLDTHGDWILEYSPGKPSDFETGWGNPVTTPAMIQKFKEAGFNAIRVPVTWYQHLDKDNMVNEEWMQRVEEVVNYVLNTGMYCILNVHHDTGDGGWLAADLNNYSTISARYKKLWEQIAAHFQAYDQHLIFESYNEMLDEQNHWTETNGNGYKAQNALLQDFVDVVRATGGNNRYRNLSINPYSAAHTPLTLNNFVVPTDIVKDRLIAQVHVYSPYSFALDKDSPVKDFTSADAQEITDIMSRLNERFCSKGIPVIIGEFSSEDKNNTPERVKHAAHLVKEATRYGIVCIKWMGLLDRKALTWNEPEILEAIIQNARQN